MNQDPNKPVRLWIHRLSHHGVILNSDQKHLIAVDVDGTLLNTEFDDVLGAREIAALKAVRQAGHELALCTGRNTLSVNGLLEKSGWVPDDLPLVLLNGALVKGCRPPRQLVCNVLAAEKITGLIPLFRKHGTMPLVYGTDEDGGVVHHETRAVNDILGHYLGVRRHTVGAIHTAEDLLEIPWNVALEVGTIDKREKIMALTAEIHATWPGQFEVINTRSLLGGGKYYWAEVYRAGSDKGSGLKVLAADLGISLAQVVAIGDNYNDLAMFAVAGCSVAMGNSPDDVKTEVHFVAPDIAQNGAAQVLEQIAAGTFQCGQRTID